MSFLRILVAILFFVYGAAGCDGGNGEADAQDGDADVQDLIDVEDAADVEADDVGEVGEDVEEEEIIEDVVDEEEIQLGGLGDPCSSPSDCEGDICVTQILFPGFEGGYCSSMMCDPLDSESCGPDGACVDLGWEDTPTLCARACEDESDCRDEHDCAGICLPGDFVSEPTLPGVLEPDDALILSVVEGIDSDRMHQRMEELTGETAWDSPDGPVTISSRAVGHPDHVLAEDYLESTLVNMGIETTRLEFELDLVTYVNIEARITGADPSLDPVYVTGHYDSTAKRTVDWNETVDPAPGASDNGTGVIILLDIAEVLAGLHASDPLQRSVVFVLFDGEELGLFGSNHYVQDLTGAGETILCVMNVDMVGWDTDITPGRYWYMYDPPNESKAVLGLEAIADFVPDAMPIPSYLPYNFETWGGSDHSSFWDAGYCASSMSTYPPERYYHTVDDLMEWVDWDYFVIAARSAAAVVAAWTFRWSD